MMKTTKKIVSIVVAVGMFCCLSIPVFATDVTADKPIVSTVGVNGDVIATTITVTVPTALSFAINPNNANVITTVPASFTNLSNVGVTIDFLGMKSKGSASAKVVKNDKFPNWKNLSANETNENIALGLKCGTNTYWSPAQTDTAFTDMKDAVGTIPLDAVGGISPTKTIDLEIKTGNAWATSKSLSFDMGIRISLMQ